MYIYVYHYVYLYLSFYNKKLTRFNRVLIISTAFLFAYLSFYNVINICIYQRFPFSSLIPAIFLLPMPLSYLRIEFLCVIHCI